MKILILFFCGLLLGFQNVSAQISIRGKVVTQKDEPIIAATVSLSSTDSTKTIAMCVTDDSGKFVLNTKPISDCILKIDYIGETIYSQHFSTEKDTDAGIIKIDHHQPETIGEVTITSRKPSLKMQSGKLIYTPNIISAGNAIDVIKTTPTLLVQDDIITMIGKGEPDVMVNDKLLRMDAATYLKSLSAKDIAKIEIVRNPTAEQDAENQNGYINIILKKQTDNGVQISANTAFTQGARFAANNGMSMNVTKNRVQLYANANATKGQSIRRATNDIFYTPYTLQQKQDQISDNSSVNATLGLDYNIAKNTTIGTSGIYSTNKKLSKDIFTNNVLGSVNSIDSFSVSNSSQPTDNPSFSYNFYAEQKFDSTGKKLRFDFDYFRLSQNAQQDFTNNYYTATGAVSRDATRFLSGNNGNMNIATANLNCELPFEKIKYSFGGKLTFIRNTNENSFYNIENGNLVADPTQFDNFIYTENTQALFAQAEKTFGKWSLLVGLRGENTQTNGVSITQSVKKENNYFKSFPTANISYQPNDKNMFSLSYSRHVERPILAMINPFRRYDGENSYSQGNPSLQPFTTGNVEFTYIYNQHLTGIASYNHGNNSFAEVQIVTNNNNIQVTQVNNFIDFDEITFVLMADYDIFKKWKCKPEVAFGHNDIISQEEMLNSSSNNYVYAGCNNQIMINEKKTLLIDTNFYFMSPTTSGTFAIKSTFGSNAGITYLAMDKKLKMNLAINDIFKTQAFRYSSTVNDIYRNRYAYNDSRNISFSISYNFSSGAGKSASHQKANDEEMSRTKS